MWIENQVFKEDMDYIIRADFIDWKILQSKTIFITGATGLIGYYLISSLVYKNLVENYNIKIIALVRNINKAKNMYKKQLLLNTDIKFIQGELENLPYVEDKIDYIIHGASPTESRFLIESPVEAITSIVIGSKNIFELGITKDILGMVYLSSMEVYGDNQSEKPLTESDCLKLDSVNIRNCYPIGKAMVENMALSYFKEYNVPVNSLRLSQTIGIIGNIPKKKKKIIQEIVDCVLQKKDIVLLTKGISKRTYIYIRDVITAIFRTLFNSKYGEIYNVSNQESFCSIYDISQMVAKEIANNKIKVLIRDTANTEMFPKTNYLNLSSEKLLKLNWHISVDLIDMFRRIIGDDKIWIK